MSEWEGYYYFYSAVCLAHHGGTFSPTMRERRTIFTRHQIIWMGQDSLLLNVMLVIISDLMEAFLYHLLAISFMLSSFNVNLNVPYWFTSFAITCCCIQKHLDDSIRFDSAKRFMVNWVQLKWQRCSPAVFRIGDLLGKSFFVCLAFKSASFHTTWAIKKLDLKRNLPLVKLFASKICCKSIFNKEY